MGYVFFLDGSVWLRWHAVTIPSFEMVQHILLHSFKLKIYVYIYIYYINQFYCQFY